MIEFRGHLVEGCAGTAAVSLHALAGEPVEGLVGFMGSKARWGGKIVSRLADDCASSDQTMPHGPASTSVTRSGRTQGPNPTRREVARILTTWAEEDPNELFTRLCVPPFSVPVDAVAQYLWLQARSAGRIPVWWSEEEGSWRSPSGSRTEAAHARGNGSPLLHRRKGAESRRSHARAA